MNYAVTRRSGTRLSPSNAITTPGTPQTTPEAPASPPGSSAKVTNTDEGDVFADIAVGVQTLLSPEGRFNIDRKAALLQVTDFPDRLDQVQLYLDAVYLRATRQVQIQAKVIDVALNAGFAAGIDWQRLIERAGDAVSLVQNAAPIAGVPTIVRLNVRDFNGLLDVSNLRWLR